MIDAYASERQYLEHIAPLWQTLPIVSRGTFHVELAIGSAAALHGIVNVRYGRPPAGGTTIVASFADHRTARRVGRPVVYLEHGAGQTYLGDPLVAAHPSYSGSGEHDGTVLFLCPSETVAARWRGRYPDVPAVAVGCPKLDGLHAGPDRARARTLAGATVAFTFHNDLALCPETRSAFRHYSDALPAVVAALKARGATVVGHAHPRLWQRLAPRWWEMGVETVEHSGEVLARTDVLCVDNSSVLYEAASCGVPTVAMNAPWYRRDVEHGLRFWSHIPGISCDHAHELPGAIAAALADGPALRDRREWCVREVYAYTDGRCAERAADAIRTYT